MKNLARCAAGRLPSTEMTLFLRRLLRLVQPYRFRLVLGIICGVLAGVAEPLMVGVIAFVFAMVFPAAKSPTLEKWLQSTPDYVQHWMQNAQDSMASGGTTHIWAVIGIIGLIPVAIFLRGLLGWLNLYFLQWVAVRTINDLRVQVFTHLLNLSTKFFTASHSSELISRVMNDTNVLRTLLSSTAITLVKDPVILVVTMGGLLIYQPRLTLLSLAIVPVCVVPIAIFNRKLRRSAREMQSNTASLTEVMSEAFTGNRVVKAYNLEPHVIAQFRQIAAKFIGHYMRVVRSSETAGPMLEFCGAIGVSLVIFYAFARSSTTTSLVDFLAFLLALQIMYKPLKSLVRIHNTFEQARAASDRVFELLATQNSVPEPAQPKPVKAAGAEIHFDNVQFAYGDKPVLRGIDLRIKPGQLVALVGASGSGKTTIANLLLRFDDPQSGAVRIGGTDLREFLTNDLRSQIAVVTQENILFNETIRRNIELGRPGATQDEIVSAAEHAHAHEFILAKPQGYDTVVGEKGVTLSGGQKQRLAIARAVVRNAPILILDEATSALDTESERAVQSALDELMKGRTTLCIAHRLSTILHADVIVVLEQGKIVEMGRHNELVKSGGVYQKLYELQFRS